MRHTREVCVFTRAARHARDQGRTTEANQRLELGRGWLSSRPQMLLMPGECEGVATAVTSNDCSGRHGNEMNLQMKSAMRARATGGDGGKGERRK